MRVLFDTNVFISAIITAGRSAKVLDYCVVNHILVTSEYILEEVREKLAEKFDYTDSEASAASNTLRKHSEVIKHGLLPAPVSRDPDDDNILAAAVAGECDIIVSGDKDLLVLSEYRGIPIVTPHAFQDMMQF